MSMKIYNGWICRSNDLVQEIDRIQAMRPRVRDIAHEVRAKWCAIKSADYFDDAWKKGETVSCLRERVVLELMDREAEIERSKRRDALDCTASIVLIAHDGAILACVYAQNKAMTEVLTEGMDYFGYWNNSDKPDNMSDEDWDQRGYFWENALSRDPASRPAGCGVVIEFMVDHNLISKDAILRHLPQKYMRAKRLARLDMIERHITPVERTLTPGQIVAITMSPSYQEELEHMTINLAAQLPDISQNDL